MTTIKTSYALFGAALDAAAQASTDNSTFPAFKAVRLDAVAQSGQLRLTCFNGAVAGRAVIGVDVDEDVSVHVNALVLREVVRAMGKGEITLTLKDGKLTAKSGGSKSTLNVMDVDIPAIPEENFKDIFALSGASWRSLTRVSPFASSDQSKPSLMSVYFTTMENAGTSYVGAVAADGFAAASMVAPAVGTLEAGAKLSLPVEFVKAAGSQVDDADLVKVQDAGSGKYAIVITNEAGKSLCYAGVAVGEPFPADTIVQLYQSASSNTTTFKAPKAEIARAVSQVAAMGSVNMFLYANGSVRAASSKTDYGQSRMQLADHEVVGVPAKKWLGVGYIKKVIGAFSSEAVSVKLDSGKPIVLFDDGAGFSALVAAINITDDVKFEEEEEQPVAVEIPQMALMEA